MSAFLAGIRKRSVTQTAGGGGGRESGQDGAPERISKGSTLSEHQRNSAYGEVGGSASRSSGAGEEELRNSASEKRPAFAATLRGVISGRRKPVVRMPSATPDAAEDPSTVYSDGELSPREGGLAVPWNQNHSPEGEPPVHDRVAAVQSTSTIRNMFRRSGSGSFFRSSSASISPPPGATLKSGVAEELGQRRRERRNSTNLTDGSPTSSEVGASGGGAGGESGGDVLAPLPPRTNSGGHSPSSLLMSGSMMTPDAQLQSLRRMLLWEHKVLNGYEKLLIFYKDSGANTSVIAQVEDIARKARSEIAKHEAERNELLSSQNLGMSGQIPMASSPASSPRSALARDAASASKFPVGSGALSSDEEDADERERESSASGTPLTQSPQLNRQPRLLKRTVAVPRGGSFRILRTTGSGVSVSSDSNHGGMGSSMSAGDASSDVDNLEEIARAASVARHSRNQIVIESDGSSDEGDLKKSPIRRPLSIRAKPSPSIQVQTQPNASPRKATDDGGQSGLPPLPAEPEDDRPSAAPPLPPLPPAMLAEEQLLQSLPDLPPFPPNLSMLGNSGNKDKAGSALQTSSGSDSMSGSGKLGPMPNLPSSGRYGVATVMNASSSNASDRDHAPVPEPSLSRNPSNGFRREREERDKGVVVAVTQADSDEEENVSQRKGGDDPRSDGNAVVPATSPNVLAIAGRLFDKRKEMQRRSSVSDVAVASRSGASEKGLESKFSVSSLMNKEIKGDGGEKSGTDASDRIAIPGSPPTGILGPRRLPSDSFVPSPSSPRTHASAGVIPSGPVTSNVVFDHEGSGSRHGSPIGTPVLSSTSSSPLLSSAPSGKRDSEGDERLFGGAGEGGVGLRMRGVGSVDHMDPTKLVRSPVSMGSVGSIGTLRSESNSIGMAPSSASSRPSLPPHVMLNASRGKASTLHGGSVSMLPSAAAGPMVGGGLGGPNALLTGVSMSPVGQGLSMSGNMPMPRSPLLSRRRAETVARGTAALLSVEKVGWLTKKGKQRWFLLRGKMLYWFSKERDTEGDIAKGVNNFMRLNDCLVGPCDSNSGHPKFSFAIEPPETGDKSYVLTAKDQRDMESWIVALEAAVAVVGENELVDCGYLMKKGKRRFFVVEDDQLAWYLSDKVKKEELKGCLRLDSCRLSADADNLTIILDSTTAIKSYSLICPSRSEFRRWMETLEMAVDQAQANAHMREAVQIRKNLRQSVGLQSSLMGITFSIEETVPVSGADTKMFTAYVIQILDMSGRCRVVLKRYNQFDELQRVLQKIYDRSILPQLPQKRIMGNFNPTVIRNRCLGLQNYLNKVAKLDGIMEVGEFIYFLTEEEINDGWLPTQKLSAADMDKRWQWVESCCGVDKKRGPSGLISQLIHLPPSAGEWHMETGLVGSPPWLTMRQRSATTVALFDDGPMSVPGGGGQGGQGVAGVAGGGSPGGAGGIGGVSSGGSAVGNVEVVEDGQDETVDSLVIEELVERDFTYYRKYFAEGDHDNWVGHGEGENENVGSMVVSLSAEGTGIDTQNKSFKAYVRTKKGDERLTLSSKKTSRVERMKELMQLVGLPNVKLTRVPANSSASYVNALLEYEKKFIVTRYKFGVLYLPREGLTEDELYQVTTVSDKFEEFLAVMGEKIALQGWTKYSGGLDVRHGSTGTNSIYAQHRHFEIMFHVAPYLPFFPHDVQQVERKRHLGNDVVVLIFSESSKPFDPTILRSHFNHAFVVVSPVDASSPDFASPPESASVSSTNANSSNSIGGVNEDGLVSGGGGGGGASPRKDQSSDGIGSGSGIGSSSPSPSSETKYRIECCFKSGVRPYRPFLPMPSVMSAGPQLRDFLLTKLINCERGAMHAAEFVGLDQRTRATLLKDLEKRGLQ